jgi:hypothetical protein
MEKLVTVGTFDFPAEADAGKLLLESFAQSGLPMLCSAVPSPVLP